MARSAEWVVGAGVGGQADTADAIAGYGNARAGGVNADEGSLTKGNIRSNTGKAHAANGVSGLSSSIEHEDEGEGGGEEQKGAGTVRDGEVLDGERANRDEKRGTGRSEDRLVTKNQVSASICLYSST